MDLLKILHDRVDALPTGDHTVGIKAVVQHIEVATRHLERGQGTVDETAFTDAVYRTNQAFEGSLKEAYRVLTDKDPANQRTFDIENYLQNENILRTRVLDQLRNYRQQWRNPSTHDYRLDFDENEALLAIVSVSAFAIVLVDQITERISFERTKAATASTEVPIEIDSNSNADQVADLLETFVKQFSQRILGQTDLREVEITGALAGFLDAAAPSINVQLEGLLHPDEARRADLLLDAGNERLLIEVKRFKERKPLMREKAVQQVLQYMTIGSINQAILLIVSGAVSGQVTRMERAFPATGHRIIILSVE